VRRRDGEKQRPVTSQEEDLEKHDNNFKQVKKDATGQIHTHIAKRRTNKPQG